VIGFHLVAAMFSIIPNPLFSTVVRLSVPGTEEGAPITVTWKHKGARALSAWLASAATRTDDAEFLAEVISDWQGVHGADGAAVPFSRESLAVLLDAYPSAGQELVRHYRHELADARAKN
jgi:Phage tail assembly chaperone